MGMCIFFIYIEDFGHKQLIAKVEYEYLVSAIIEKELNRMEMNGKISVEKVMVNDNWCPVEVQ